MTDPVVTQSAAAHYWLAVATDGTVTDAGTSEPGAGLPAGVTVVTLEQYQTAVETRADGGSLRYINGVLKLGHIPTMTLPTIAQLRASAEVRIDAAAEEARLQFLTPGSGQALEYQETQSEALLLKQILDAKPDQVIVASDLPYLKAEQDACAAVGVTVSLLQVANAVLATRAAWDTGARSASHVNSTKVHLQGR